MANKPLPAYDGDEPYVFVSYSHKDDALVLPEIRWLQDQGFNVWWDEGISPGASWRAELVEALRGCSVILFYVTPNSVASVQCVREITYGIDEYKRPIIAVHHTVTDLPDALGLVLADRQAILREAIEPADYERKLVTAIAAHLERSVPVELTRGPTRRVRTSSVLGGASLLVVILLAVAVATGWFTSQPPAAPSEFLMDLPAGVKLFYEEGRRTVAVAPDGRRIAFVATDVEGVRRLYLRELASRGIRQLSPATQTGIVGPVMFSPDGNWVAYGDWTDDAFGLVKVNLTSRETLKILVAGQDGPHGAAWSPDGTIVYDGQRLAVIPDVGGDPRWIEATDATYHQPQDAGDGESVVVWRAMPQDEKANWGSLYLMSKASGRKELLIDNAHSPRVLEDTLLFARGGGVWAVGFDGRSVTGDPVRVLEGVSGEIDTPWGPTARYDVAGGTLVYQPGAPDDQVEIVTLDRSGVEQPMRLPAGQYHFFSQSPDGSRMVVQRSGDIWVYDYTGITPIRLTYGEAPSHSPIWSPDGDWIVFGRGGAVGGRGLFRVRSDGSGRPERLTTSKRQQFAQSWSEDGRYVFYYEGAYYSGNPGSRRTGSRGR